MYLPRIASLSVFVAFDPVKYRNVKCPVLRCKVRVSACRAVVFPIFWGQIYGVYRGAEAIICHHKIKYFV